MSAILTPSLLWKNFDDSLPLTEHTSEITTEDGVTYEKVTFLGRRTEAGRVKVFGMFAYAADAPSPDGVLVIPDSKDTVDPAVLALMVRNGYSALMVDIRGDWGSSGEFTVYPPDISYANYTEAGRTLDHVDDSAADTCWYEWVAVGLYAAKYLSSRIDGNIGVVGIRDGGEVTWKLAYAGDFACAVPVCAVGWRAYRGFAKFGGEEPSFDEDRHRFIAAIDSQSYAPYVKCPVLMLCAMNDFSFDYDRAYDTFSRINPEHIGDSVIAYSMRSHSCVDSNCVKDMFMFFDKHIKDRQVFIPKPAEISLGVDEQSNLVARAELDMSGDACKVIMYTAEDCKFSCVRDWMTARPAGDGKKFFADIYEKTSVLFAVCSVTYTNGFTVWSKIGVRRLGGTFRNSRHAGKVLYSARDGVDCFFSADCAPRAAGGVFLTDDGLLPALCDTVDDLKGLTSPCGLMTFRALSPRFAPLSDSVLKFDAYSSKDSVMTVVVTEVGDGVNYECSVKLVGGAWQSVVLESKLFKNGEGRALADFCGGVAVTIVDPSGVAVNNAMWL